MAQRKVITDEIATLGRTAWGLQTLLSILPDPDPILMKRGGGLAIYRELLIDDHLWGCIQSRKSGVELSSWDIISSDSSAAAQKALEFTRDVFRSLDVSRIAGEGLDAVLFGYAPMEIVWESDDGLVYPRDVVGKPPEWFIYDDQHRLRFLSKQHPTDGEIVPELSFLCVVYRGSYTNPYGERTLSRCYWPVVFKKTGIKWFAIFTEKYGMGYLLGTVPRGAGADTKREMKDMLDQMVQDATGVIAEDNKVESIEMAGKASSALVYERFIDQCTRAISKAILGHTLSAEHPTAVGSYAATQGALDVRAEFIESDKRMIEEQLFNTVIRYMWRLNFDANSFCPLAFRYDRPMDLKLEKAQRDAILFQFIRPPEGYIYDEYGIPKPTPPQAQMQFVEKASVMDIGSRFMRRLSALIDDGIKQATMHYDTILKRIKSIVSSWESFDDIGGLSDVISNMKQFDAIAELLGAGMLISHYGGRQFVYERLKKLKGMGFAEPPDDDWQIVRPIKAIEWFRNKVPLRAEEFYRLSDDFKSYGFTVSGVEQERLLTAIQDEVAKAMYEGKTLTQFKDEIDKLFDAAGVSRLEPYHIANVFHTNLASAYAAGEWEALQSTKNAFPYYRIVTMPDACPLCSERTGKVFSTAAGGVWPPFHYQCRCYADPLTADEARGQEISRSEDLTPPMEGFGSPANMMSGIRSGTYNPLKKE